MSVSETSHQNKSPDRNVWSVMQKRHWYRLVNAGKVVFSSSRGIQFALFSSLRICPLSLTKVGNGLKWVHAEASRDVSSKAGSERFVTYLAMLPIRPTIGDGNKTSFASHAARSKSALSAELLFELAGVQVGERNFLMCCRFRFAVRLGPHELGRHFASAQSLRGGGGELSEGAVPETGRPAHRRKPGQAAACCSRERRAVASSSFPNAQSMYESEPGGIRSIAKILEERWSVRRRRHFRRYGSNTVLEKTRSLVLHNRFWFPQSYAKPPGEVRGP